MLPQDRQTRAHVKAQVPKDFRWRRSALRSSRAPKTDPPASAHAEMAPARPGRRTGRTPVEEEVRDSAADNGGDTGDNTKHNTDGPTEVAEDALGSKDDEMKHVAGFEASTLRFGQEARMKAENEAVGMSHSRRTPANDDTETISGLADGETAADDVEPSCESYATEGSDLNRASDKDTQQNDAIDLKATKQSLHAPSSAGT
ncbi:hypothetical protein PI124_g1617 [Phytophthora idaei]|nr:hypothetical protein PI124_g1617 [Phytophthora idaei]